jgi:FkbM family methyltransferase
MTLKQLLKLYYVAYRYRLRINKAEIEYVLAHLSKGDTAIDIGAHKGGYLYWMRKRVGIEGKLVAFEPQESLYRQLLEITRHFKWNNVQVEKLGVSNARETHRFYIPVTPDGSSAEASMTDYRVGMGEYKETTIETISLDEYCTEASIRPAFIKIDVEGFEYEVLTGGRQILQTYRPKILMECEQRHLKDRKVGDVFKVLLELGYKGFFIHDNQVKPLAEFNVASHQDSNIKGFETSGLYANNFIFE